MRPPPVSVVLPTYNRATLLPGAVCSIQSQSLADWELIVVDDGSTDNTNDVLRSIAAADRRVRIISNPGPSGPGGARNAGFRVANAPAVAFLDSDDRWRPTKLAKFVAELNSDQDIVLVGSDYLMVDRAVAQTTSMKSFLFDTMIAWWENYPLAAAVIPCAFLREDVHAIAAQDHVLSMTIAGFLWIQTSSVIVRRDAAILAGMFDARLQRTEDIDLWLKLSRLGRFAYIDEVLATYDITGRDGALGDRYERHSALRRHTGYTEALHHLRLLRRIKRTYQLSAEQRELLRERLTEHHRRCAKGAWRERRVRGLLHLVPTLASDLEKHGRKLNRQFRDNLQRSDSQR